MEDELAWAKYHISVTSNGLAVPDDHWPLANYSNVPNAGQVANAAIRLVCIRIPSGRVVPAAALFATAEIKASAVNPASHAQHAQHAHHRCSPAHSGS